MQSITFPYSIKLINFGIESSDYEDLIKEIEANPKDYQKKYSLKMKFLYDVIVSRYDDFAQVIPDVFVRLLKALPSGEKMIWAGRLEFDRLK